MTRQEFLSRAAAVWGDRFDYGLVLSDTVRVGDKIELADRQAGLVAVQRVDRHLDGMLPKKLAARRDTLPTDAFVKKAVAVHGSRFDYSRVKYVGSKVKVEIVCPEHGSFLQSPDNHLQGQGCKYCSGVGTRTKREFVSAARKAHGDKYCYDKADYTNARNKLTVVCAEHGEFSVAPMNHVYNKTGCPKCANNGPSPASQDLLDFLEMNGAEVMREVRLQDDMGAMVVDGVVGNLAIEYHGLYWHGTKFFMNRNDLDPVADSNEIDRGVKFRHRDRRRRLEALGYRYIAIYEDEWQYHQERVKTFLLGLLGKCPTVFARKCKVVPVGSAEARAFYERWHLLGSPTRLSNTLGLEDSDGQLVACMTVWKSSEVRGDNQGTWSLSRLAFAGVRIPGGASRLFKACLQVVPKGAQVLSYVDMDKFTGGVYETLGFELAAELAPDYCTIWPGDISQYSVRRHKTATKRDALAKLDGFDPGQTELQNSLRLGLHRIYHSGRLRVELVKP